MERRCETHRTKSIRNLPALGPMPVQPCAPSQTICGSDEVIACMLTSVMLGQLEMFKFDTKGHFAAIALMPASVIFVQLTI